MNVTHYTANAFSHAFALAVIMMMALKGSQHTLVIRKIASRSKSFIAKALHHLISLTCFFCLQYGKSYDKVHEYVPYWLQAGDENNRKLLRMKCVLKSAAGLVGLLLLAGADVAFAAGKPQKSAPSVNPSAVSRSFIMPAAPHPSARPDPKLPKLGRDRHGMPFYHPSQLNRVVRTTAYTHSELDHLGYGARNAVGTQLKYTNQVRSAAADWSVYPLGTRFMIKGEPYVYVVDDYGSALVGTGTIDIYHPSKDLMRKWGVRVVEIKVLRWGSSQLSMKTLADRMRYRHCAKMQASLREQSRHRRSLR